MESELGYMFVYFRIYEDPGAVSRFPASQSLNISNYEEGLGEENPFRFETCVSTPDTVPQDRLTLPSTVPPLLSKGPERCPGTVQLQDGSQHVFGLPE